MTSLKSISAAIESIPSKKEDLRKAFEDLQAHSSSLASFTLRWKDLEEHFESVEKSIAVRFKALEAGEKDPLLESIPKEVSSSMEMDKSPRRVLNASAGVETAADLQVPEVKQDDVAGEPDTPSWPELKSLCMKMNAKGLRKYIIDNRNDLNVIREEITRALSQAGDPAKLVLDALEGFYPPNSKGDRDGDLAAIRRTCVLLLEKFPRSLDANSSSKEKAKKLAFDWKEKITGGGQNLLEVIGFLQLLVAFGLVDCFDIDQIFDLIIEVARRKQTIEICRAVVPSEKISYLIQKMISKGKKIDAVNFAYTFKVVDEFPPVPLLKSYLVETKKASQEIRKKGNNSTVSQHEAIAKEIAAIRAVLKVVEDHKLDAELSRENLEKQISELESQKPEKKRSAPLMSAAYKTQQQFSYKRPRQAAMAAATSAPLPGRSDLMVDRFPAYLIGDPAPYGFAGSVGSSYYNGASGFRGPSRFSLRESPPRPHLYPTEPLYLSGAGMPDGVYERPVGHTSAGDLSPMQSFHSYRSSMYS